MVLVVYFFPGAGAGARAGASRGDASDHLLHSSPENGGGGAGFGGAAGAGGGSTFAHGGGRDGAGMGAMGGSGSHVSIWLRLCAEIVRGCSASAFQEQSPAPFAPEMEKILILFVESVAERKLCVNKNSRR